MIYLFLMFMVCFLYLPESCGKFLLFFFVADVSQYLDPRWQVNNIFKLVYSSDLHICLEHCCICCRRRDLKINCYFISYVRLLILMLYHYC